MALQKKEAAQKGSKLNLELTRICKEHPHNGPSILTASLFFPPSLESVQKKKILKQHQVILLN